jgi:plasmid stabilization system protein ParE
MGKGSSVSRVRFHPQAHKEYLDAVQWYSDRGGRLGHRFAQEVAAAVQRIEEAPQRWPVSEIETRRVLVHHFPYVIHYRFQATSNLIRIVAVAHTSRDPFYWRHRK